MTRHNVFSTPIWHIEGTSQQLLDELYQKAYEFKKEYPSNQKSNQGGYQSPSFEWKNFHPQGIEYINKIIDESFEKKFKISKCQWWYNINPKGAWNLPHTHPNCDYALVLYLTDSDGLLRLMNPFLERHHSSGDYVSINAKKGDILMFPADIYHYVMPNPREEDRISISMNLRLS